MSAHPARPWVKKEKCWLMRHEPSEQPASVWPCGKLKSIPALQEGNSTSQAGSLEGLDSSERVPTLSWWTILIKNTYKFHLFKSGMAWHCLFIHMHFIFPTKDNKFPDSRCFLYFLVFSTPEAHSAYPNMVLCLGRCSVNIQRLMES